MTATIILFPRKPKPKEGVEPCFGVCPECGGQDEGFNVGGNHFFVCHEHNTVWNPASNLFSGWRDEPAELHEANERRVQSMRWVDPYYPPEGGAG